MFDKRHTELYKMVWSRGMLGRGEGDLPRQQVAFRKKVSKIKGCGILKRNFYTRFIPENYGFWVCDMVGKILSKSKSMEEKNGLQ